MMCQYDALVSRYDVHSMMCQYYVHSMMCTVRCAQYDVHSTMCTVQCAQYDVHSVTYGQPFSVSQSAIFAPCRSSTYPPAVSAPKSCKVCPLNRCCFGGQTVCLACFDGNVRDVLYQNTQLLCGLCRTVTVGQTACIPRYSIFQLVAY
jgi:hypothetical protein